MLLEQKRGWQVDREVESLYSTAQMAPRANSINKHWLSPQIWHWENIAILILNAAKFLLAIEMDV